MAHAMTSMNGLRGSSQGVLEGSLHLSTSSRLAGSGFTRVSVSRPNVTVRSQQSGSSETETSRRAVLGFVAAGIGSGTFVQAVFAEASPIKIGPPPPPSGGLPGTLNSDEARDLDLPLKNRFFLQTLSPAAAAVRAKESAQDIVNVKEFIDKKAWPYVQNDLRSKAGYLRFDLNTVISSKPKDKKVALKALTGKLFQDLDNLDYAAKIKSSTDAEKYYAIAVTSLKDVLANV